MNRMGDLTLSPEYYPLRMDLEKREIEFVRMSRQTYRDSVFLDSRTRHLGSACTLRMDDVIWATANAGGKSIPVTYILHPAFCCSTLLARYFELLSSCLVLKEPLLLTQVALSSFDPHLQWREIFGCTVKLLARGYDATEHVVIKAHEPSNVLGRRLLQENDRASVVFLMTSQRDFVLSVLKSNERRSWVRSRVCTALASGVAGGGWKDLRPSAINDAQAAACMWSINNELREQLAMAPERSRVLLLESDDLIDHPKEALASIAQVSQQAFQAKQIDAMVAHPSMRKYSKNMSVDYDGDTRRQEIAKLERQFGTEVDAAVDWAIRYSTASAR